MEKFKTAQEAFDYLNSEISIIFQNNRFHRELEIGYFLEDILNKWKNNTSIGCCAFDATFDSLNYDMDNDIQKMNRIAYGDILERFGEDGERLEEELYKIVMNYTQELEAVRKKLKKLKRGWKTVLAGYEDLK